MEQESVHVGPAILAISVRCLVIRVDGDRNAPNAVTVSMALTIHAITKVEFANANQAGVAIIAICPVCPDFMAKIARKSVPARHQNHVIM